jgi:hypothetical protein
MAESADLSPDWIGYRLLSAYSTQHMLQHVIIIIIIPANIVILMIIFISP